MAIFFENWVIFEMFQDMQNLFERHNLKQTQKMLRDQSNPFQLPEPYFIKLFRLNKQSALELCNLLDNVLPQGIRTTYIPNHLKVLLTLNFYAYGSYQTGIGSEYCFAASQSSVSRIITSVTEAICNNLVPEKLKFPSTDYEVLQTKQRFLDKFHFPGVLGCIDCTHVAIISPPANDEIYPGGLYYNRKGYSSLNVQIICDADLKIIAMNARYPGATHDAAIWQMSNIRHHLRTKYMQGRNNTWLLGDSGYPLEPWLMTPILDAQENTPEGSYTAAHVRTRNVIERLNGLLKARFRCLLKHRVLHYSPAKAARIIYACGALHNLCMERNIDFEVEEQQVVEMDLQEHIEDNVQNNLLPQATRVRIQLVQTYFNNY